MREIQEIKADIEFVRRDFEQFRLIGASTACVLDDLMDLKAELREAEQAQSEAIHNTSQLMGEREMEG